MTTETFFFPPITEFEESFEWGTSVITCISSEALESYREYPIYTGTYKVVFKSRKDFLHAQAIAERINSNICYIPLWQSYSILVNITAGQVNLVSNICYIEFPTEDKKFLLYADNDNWEIVTVVSENGGSIVLTSGIVSSYEKAWLIPLISARIPEGINFSNSETETRTAEINFKSFYRASVDNPLVSFNSFKDYPLFELPVELSSSIVHRYTQSQEIVENPTGFSESVPVEDYSRKAFSFSVSTHGRLQFNYLKDFLFLLAGRGNLAWFRYKTSDVIPKSPILSSGATTIQVNRTHLTQKLRNFILVTGSGSLIPVEVTSITQLNATTDVLNLNTPVPFAIADLVCIDFLILARLSSDKITFRHKAKKLTSVSLSITETKPHTNKLTLPIYSLKGTIGMYLPGWTAVDSDFIYIQADTMIYKYSPATGVLTAIIPTIHMDLGNGIRRGGIVIAGGYLWKLYWEAGNPTKIAKHTTTGTFIGAYNETLSGTPYLIITDGAYIYIYTSELSMYKFDLSGNEVMHSTTLLNNYGVTSLLSGGGFVWAIANDRIMKVNPVTLSQVGECIIPSVQLKDAVVLGSYLWAIAYSGILYKIDMNTCFLVASFNLNYYGLLNISFLSNGFLAVGTYDSVLLVNPAIGTVLGSINSGSYGKVTELSGNLYLLSLSSMEIY